MQVEARYGDSEARSKSDDTKVNPVVLQLQKILSDHLAANPNLTLNGMSKRCSVSEPTLRRIMKGQIKTLASVSTVVDIISYVSKETSLFKLVGKYPGPIADFLRENLKEACGENETEYSPKLNEALKEPNKYLIYKLSVNANGVSAEEVKELLGYLGKASLDELVTEELLELKNGRYFGCIQKFSLHHDLFIKGFKSTADFIKPEKLTQAPLNNIFANLSRSVNIEAYREIVRIQQAAVRRCLRLMDEPKSKGQIPVFLLAAVDTLSTKSADELK